MDSTSMWITPDHELPVKLNGRRNCRISAPVGAITAADQSLIGLDLYKVHGRNPPSQMKVLTAVIFTNG